MSLVSANEKLFDSKEDSDITFIIDKKEIQAHQLFLVHRSPVFKAMIKGPMAPANQRHQISDPQVSYDTFNNFLKFLYTDKCDISVDNTEVLLHLSHMYDVPHLFETCVTELPELFVNTNILKFAEIGLLYENKCNMVIKCLNEVPYYLPLMQLKYSKENEMVWISPELVIEFVKHCPRTHKLNESIIFQKVFEWVNRKCEKDNREINAQNLREIMSPFVHDFCFEKMDIKILTSTVYEYKLIPDERLLKCFRDHIVQKETTSSRPKYVPPNRGPIVACMTCVAPGFTDLPPGSIGVVRGAGSVREGDPVGPGYKTFVITCNAAGGRFVVIGANQQTLSLYPVGIGAKTTTLVFNEDGELVGRTVPPMGQMAMQIIVTSVYCSNA